MDNKAITLDFYEALTAGRLTVIDEVVADHFIEHEETPTDADGRDGLREMFATLHPAFSDFAINIEDMVAEGDKGVCIPNLGKPMLVPVADVLRFEHGRIVEHWGLMDTGQLMEQLL